MSSMQKVSILVADDFAGWRAATGKILQTCRTWTVVAEACNGLEAFQKATELHPDVVLLDVSMPVLNGIEAAKKIRQASPASKIIFLTQDYDCEVRDIALATGAEGYVLKARAACDLQPAVRAALRNGFRASVPSFRPLADHSSR
jgi:DNA-binding NarL/FixJ family response regulator